MPDAELDEAAEEWIRRLSGLSGQALRAAKRAVRGDPAARLAHAGAVYRSDTLASRDGVEGLTAFLEKRKPVWT